MRVLGRFIKQLLGDHRTKQHIDIVQVALVQLYSFELSFDIFLALLIGAAVVW